MKKLTALLLCAAMILSLAFTFTACGSAAAAAPKDEDRYEMATEEAMVMTDDVYDYDNGWAMEAPAEAVAASGSVETPSENGDNYLSGLKIIKTGNMSIATESYEETDTLIRAKVTALQGMLTEHTVSGSAGTRWASYTVRIPSASFDQFFYDVSGSCVVTSQSIYSEDVTENYTDLATRLETAKKKYQRLLELMDSAETLADVYSLQSEISNVEYEIDWMTGSLNGLDSRIAYSTIYIDVTERTRTVINPVEATFGERLSAAFHDGCDNAVDGVQGFILWLAESWFGLLVFIVIVVVIVLVIRRMLNRNREEREANKAARKAARIAAAEKRKAAHEAKKLEKDEKPENNDQ